MLSGEAGLSFLYICMEMPISELVKRKKEGRPVPLCPPGLGMYKAHTHSHGHTPGRANQTWGTCNDIFQFTVSTLKPGSDLNSRRIILFYVPKCCGDTHCPVRAKVPSLWFAFYLFFISSLASSIFQKQLAVAYEKCDFFL